MQLIILILSIYPASISVVQKLYMTCSKVFPWLEIKYLKIKYTLVKILPLFYNFLLQVIWIYELKYYAGVNNIKLPVLAKNTRLK